MDLITEPFICIVEISLCLVTLVMLVTKRDRFNGVSNVLALLSECTYVYSWYE